MPPMDVDESSAQNEGNINEPFASSSYLIQDPVIPPPLPAPPPPDHPQQQGSLEDEPAIPPPPPSNVALIVDGDYLARRSLNDAAFMKGLDALCDLLNTHEDLSGATESFQYCLYTMCYLPSPLRLHVKKGFITTELSLKKGNYSLAGCPGEKIEVSVPSGLESNIARLLLEVGESDD